jgi:hypothetical protein
VQEKVVITLEGENLVKRLIKEVYENITTYNFSEAEGRMSANGAPLPGNISQRRRKVRE